MTLWICIFFSFFFHFSFVLKRREERKWVEKRFCSLFFSSLNFLIQNDRILLFLLFFLSFCFFSSVFLMIFSLFSFYLLFWEWEKENENSVISSLFSSFWGRKMRGATGKKEGSAFYFSFLFSWFFLSENPSLFQFFLLFREREKDRGNCLFRDNPFLQERLLF